MKKLSKHWIEISLASLILAMMCLYGWAALAADGQGAYTETKAVAEGYQANTESASFVTLDGTDTVTGLDDPVSKFTAARIFALRDTSSQSMGTKPNLKIQLKFSAASATADLWVVYYYVDPASPSTYNLIALKRPLGGTVAATAARDSSLYLSEAVVVDTYGATHCVVFSDSVSSGTAEAWLGSY